MVTEPGVVADGSVCHGLCRAQPAPSRPAAKRYVRWKRTKEMKQRSDELESIPGIGPRIAQKLRLIGVNKVGDFRNKDPERLYNKLEQTIGAHVDRCVLYVFRAAVYFSNHQRHDPEKLKWWNWKD